MTHDEKDNTGFEVEIPATWPSAIVAIVALLCLTYCAVHGGKP